MLLWLQEKAEDHKGAVLVTGLDCGPQWYLCGYRHQSAKNGYSVMLTTTRVALVAKGAG